MEVEGTSKIDYAASEQFRIKKLQETGLSIEDVKVT